MNKTMCMIVSLFFATFSQTYVTKSLIDINNSTKPEIMDVNIIRLDSLYKLELKEKDSKGMVTKRAVKICSKRDDLILSKYISDSLKNRDIIKTEDIVNKTIKVVINNKDYKIETNNSVYVKGLTPFNLIDFGIGLPALSINMKDQNVGFLESVVPLQISFNLFQRTLFRGKNEIHKFALWCLSGGIQISKPTNDAFKYGVVFSPYAIRIDDFSFGVGVMYSDTDEFHPSDKSKWSFVLPISYQLFNKKGN